MITRTLFGAVLLAGLVSSAIAGPAEDSARAHFKAIAAGQVDQVMDQYAGDATLQWVGGPLNGAYAGSEKIKEVWGKFSKNAPLDLSLGKVEESVNDKGATVSANVQFEGKSVIKVRYVLVYRDGKIVNEVWQIDPKLNMSGY
jgi:ketosteroid isomerase-like protein